MSIHRNLMTVCFAAVFALGLAACSSSSDDDPPEVAMPEPEPPAPTDLETTQAAAAAAAAAAMTASTNADALADGAEAATVNSATLQTGEMAMMYAMGARESADEAMAEYMKAKAASQAAAAATMASAAGAQLATAQAAQAAAEAAAAMASEKAMKAADAAKMELVIDGTMKSVGESKVDASMGMLTTTNDDGSKTITGLSDAAQPMNMVAATPGQAGAQDNPNTPADEAKTPMAMAAARDVTIGKTLDSSDDMARLMLITKYAGSKMVKVFDYTGDGTGDNAVSTMDGRIEVVAVSGDDPAEYSPLVYRGMYHLATGGTTSTTGIGVDDTVAANAKPVRVYSYVDVGTDTELGTDDDVTVHVVLHESSTPAGGKTTNTYRKVDVTETLPAVGATDGTEIQLPAKEVPVMAEIPAAMAYDHIHFGVWASLGGAEKDGSQTIADLGIGFVQSIGDGMTATMPNQGMAKYEGDWVAAIQGASEGAMSLEHGSAMLEANLDKSTLKATLSGLATLSGALDGNTFSGTKASVTTGDPYGLNTGGSFTGTFSGGFYGDKAAEAGGVFDFTSDDIADGAFRGAFGGDRKDDE